MIRKRIYTSATFLVITVAVIATWALPVAYGDPDLALYWDLNDGQGTSVLDKSGNQQHGSF